MKKISKKFFQDWSPNKSEYSEVFGFWNEILLKNM